MAENLSGRGLLGVTALGAPGAPAVLAGSLLPEDTGYRIPFQTPIVPEADVDWPLKVVHRPVIQLGPQDIVIEQ